MEQACWAIAGCPTLQRHKGCRCVKLLEPSWPPTQQHLEDPRASRRQLPATTSPARGGRMGRTTRCWPAPLCAPPPSHIPTPPPLCRVAAPRTTAAAKVDFLAQRTRSLVLAHRFQTFIIASRRRLQEERVRPRDTCNPVPPHGNLSPLQMRRGVRILDLAHGDERPTAWPPFHLHPFAFFSCYHRYDWEGSGH